MRAVPVAFALLLLAGGCSHSPSAPGAYTVSGRVRLTGHLLDAGSHPAGTRVVMDADGVPVQLVQGSRVVAVTRTIDGVFRFTGVPAGSYFARSIIVNGLADDSRDMVVAVRDVEMGDTLDLASAGDIAPVPNPVADSTTFWFELAQAAHVHVQVRSLAGSLVRDVLLADLAPGLHLAGWNGRTAAGDPAPGTMWWVTIETGTESRAQLIFR